MWLCKRDLSKECDGKYRDCTNCVLDKIRAEIEYIIDNTYDSTDYDNGAYRNGLYEALDIIDKYKIESEKEE